MKIDMIQICEDAAFRAYNGARKKKMRMTIDWFDWSVEHMSKWWKYSDWERDPNTTAYNRITEQFTKYIENADTYPMEEEPLLKETIAIIPFQAYTHPKTPEMGYNLTVHSLAATIESMRRAGFGRVTVGILVVADFDIVQDAFRFLLDRVQPGNSHDPREIVTQVGHMELGYAVIPEEITKTKNQKKNMPKGVLLQLREAFLYSQQDEVDIVKKRVMESWFGTKHDPSYFKYIYLTEADTILLTRPRSIPALKNELDKGGVLLPHRLQPIPHESDVKGSNEKFFVSEKFKNVIALDPTSDACCDEQAGPDFKPGKPPYMEKCGGFWYSCGLGRRVQGTDEERHRRLAPYNFMRLLGGTEIVSIAGNEHGRRCIPTKNAACKPIGKQIAY